MLYLCGNIAYKPHWERIIIFARVVFLYHFFQIMRETIERKGGDRMEHRDDVRSDSIDDRKC